LEKCPENVVGRHFFFFPSLPFLFYPSSLSICLFRQCGAFADQREIRRRKQNFFFFSLPFFPSFFIPLNLYEATSE